MKKQVVETFMNPFGYSLNTLVKKEPSAVNSVTVKKYRITVEEIEEPDSVYEERLKSIYANTKNHHHHSAIREYAKRNKLNIDFITGKS